MNIIMSFIISLNNIPWHKPNALICNINIGKF